MGADGLVGRDREVGQLRSALGDLAAGRGRAVLVEGEPGIGKSALLRVGLAGAERSGCQVFAATAEELGQRFPLRVMLDCLAVGPRSADPARREIVGLLHGGGSGVGTAPADPVPAAVERLLAMVDRLCAAAPVLLVVDDLQWADEASVSVWHRLGRAVRQLPLLLVGACRPVPRRAELVALRRGLVAADAVVVGLEPLPVDESVVLAAAVAGAGSVGPGLRRAVGQAAGNPLYVRELVDALGREGRLRRAGGSAELVEGAAVLGVPASLAAAISDRLGFVSDQTLGVLRAAALLGAEFSVADLGVVVGRSAVELAGPVAEAAAAGVLAESGPRLAFRHVLIRQALYEGMPVGVRLALHAQAARGLAAAGATVERVAEQLLAAITAVDPSPPLDGWALDWLSGPGRALAHRTPQVAAELLDRALDRLPVTDARREELQASLVGVLFLLGRHEETASLARQVLAATRDITRAAAATWTLGWALIRIQQYESARSAIERGLTDLPLDEGWTARLRALLPMVAAGGGDLEEAELLARAAIAAADRAGDRIAAASASNTLCFVRTRRGDLAGGLAAAERGLGLLGDDPETADLRILLMHNRMSGLSGLDRLAEADAAVREALDAAERYAAPPRLAAIRSAAAEHYYQVGGWDDALAELEAIADGTLPVVWFYRLLLHGISALIAGHRDDQAATAAQLGAMADLPIQSGESLYHAQYVLMARALVAERQGHPAQALAALTTMLDPAHAKQMSERRLWLADAVRLALAVGDPDTARAAAEAGAADAATEPTPTRTAAAEHCAGLLDGDPSRLLAAAAGYRGVGRPVQLAQALEDAAVMLAGHSDVPAARAAYAEAAGIYHGLGAEWDLLRAYTRLRPYHIRRSGGPRRRPATGWDALTGTEVRVARLVGGGLSNPDIAADLFLSRRTVETHVSHILAKLGARSRVEIAHAVTVR
jgi:DNA-binding CsgD family transcriptional regulator/tetratricopeptide (TPR) repeat protein